MDEKLSLILLMLAVSGFFLLEAGISLCPSKKGTAPVQRESKKWRHLPQFLPVILKTLY